MEVLDLFKIGNKVIYPMYGLGVISSIEEKEFIGEKKQYYTINLLNNNMNVMISAEKILDSNLRPINDLPTLEKIFSTLRNEKSDSTEEITPKQRYQLNMEKMKSGELKKGIELIRDLTHINTEKALSSNEMQMLTTTRKFIISEIALIKNMTEEQADDLLTAVIS
jgi:CarD family transcriptional regulator